MSIELVEVEIPFAGITAIEVEVVTGSLPGLGSPIISDTAPTPPVNGMRWLDTDGWIESVWSAVESAWIVPATNSIPADAVTFGGELLTFGGEILTFAAA